jgi:hypothetical protein
VTDDVIDRPRLSTGPDHGRGYIVKVLWGDSIKLGSLAGDINQLP